MINNVGVDHYIFLIFDFLILKINITTIKIIYSCYN